MGGPPPHKINTSPNTNASQFRHRACVFSLGCFNQLMFDLCCQGVRWTCEAESDRSEMQGFHSYRRGGIQDM